MIREFKSDHNTLPNKSGNQLESSSTYVPKVSKVLLRAFGKLFYLRFFASGDQSKSTVQQGFYWQFERHFYMKLIINNIPTNLFTNSL